MSRQKIDYYDRAYKKLRAGWERARERIIAVTNGAGFDSYKVVEDKEGDEVFLLICGARVYVRFKHDLENGFLEYGVVRDSLDGRLERFRIKVIRFDKWGNVAQHWTLTDADAADFGDLHLKTLTEITPEIVRLYFDSPQTNQKKEHAGTAPNREDQSLSEQGLAEWADALDAEDRG